MQTKRSSLIESAINLVIGVAISLTTQWLIFPMYGINVPFETNVYLVWWFTVISFIRTYAIRRWFNARIQETASRLAGD